MSTSDTKLIDVVNELKAELKAEMRAMRAELHGKHEKQIKTRRAKVLKGAIRSRDIPVSDIAFASANRALQKMGVR